MLSRLLYILGTPLVFIVDLKLNLVDKLENFSKKTRRNSGRAQAPAKIFGGGGGGASTENREFFCLYNSGHPTQT